MRRREREMVPEAEFESYYGRPIIKEPTWKVPDVPLYLFLGGLAGVSASTAALADLTGRPGLARSSRYVAAGGALTSVGALIHDLGRPERFLNMLRVFKVTSPLSVGSWILAPFSALTAGAAISELSGWFPRLGRTAGAVAAGLGPAMATYTAVLLSDTAVPAWHEYHRELPFVFAGSALTSAGGAALLAAPLAEQAPARALVVLGTGLEQAASHRIEHSDTIVAEPYRTGRPRTLLRAGKALTAVGAGLAVLAGYRSRVTGDGAAGATTGITGQRGRLPTGRAGLPARVAGLLAPVAGRRGGRLLAGAAGAGVLAGSLCLRFGIFYAGRESARDPKYTVIPQRERLSSRRPGDSSDRK